MSKRIEELKKGCGGECEKGFSWICGSYNLIPSLVPQKGEIVDFCDKCEARIEERKLAEKEFLDKIDNKWNELTFDLHTRFCNLEKEDTWKHCDKFKEQVKEELKKELGK